MAKILLVEDNETISNMLARRLARRGHEVLVAGDGKAGIAAASREQPAIILMDLSLPEIDGWSASRRIKADRMTRHIPIIALTAHAMQGDREKALAAGCDDYQTKPVDFPQLLSRIDSFINDGAVS